MVYSPPDRAMTSANYTINEWLDADFDRHHPIKRDRAAAAGRITARIVYCNVPGAIVRLNVLVEHRLPAPS
jgi:hypothetical protein